MSIRGLIGTILFHLLVLFLLIFFGFSYPDPPPDEEGIEVNFGTDDYGLGEVEPVGNETQGGVEETVPEETQEAIETSTATPVKETAPQETVVKEAQTYEESPVKEKKPTAEEIKKEEEKIKNAAIAKQKAAEEKIRQEELRKEREEAEKRRIQAEKLQKLGKDAFGNKGVGTEQGSEGVTQGTGNQGDISGTPDSDNYDTGGGLGNGNSYSLGDRKVKGQLPKPIVGACEVTAKITVQIQIDVDNLGNVVGAPKVLKATYQDDCIYEAVLKAAKLAKFSPSDQYRQRGWITYIIEPTDQ
jgi:colicin import membrane protein